MFAHTGNMMGSPARGQQQGMFVTGRSGKEMDTVLWDGSRCLLPGCSPRGCLVLQYGDKRGEMTLDGQ